METLDSRVAALSPGRRRLLLQLIGTAPGEAVGARVVPVARSVSESHHPMSFAQQRMWIIDQLQPGNCLYNEHGQLHLEGELDLGCLRRALDEVSSRHETLRTTFGGPPDAAVQIVWPDRTIPIDLADLTGLAESRKLAEVSRLATCEAHRPFDLATGPDRKSVV